ncbi:MAG TPA: hypothetical protein VK629_11530 [Steroidobacteraceae bacterium]|nr:hypothetical protein [Steroidobacteraceae bacterium]
MPFFTLIHDRSSIEAARAAGQRIFEIDLVVDRRMGLEVRVPVTLRHLSQLALKTRPANLDDLDGEQQGFNQSTPVPPGHAELLIESLIEAQFLGLSG